MGTALREGEDPTGKAGRRLTPTLRWKSRALTLKTQSFVPQTDLGFPDTFSNVSPQA